MQLAPEPKVVMTEATMTALRAGRFPPAEVIRRQLDALAEAGYRLKPHLDDGGAALMLTATKRAFQSGRVAPATVVARQLAAIEEAGYAFVRRSEAAVACESLPLGAAVVRLMRPLRLSFWRHADGAGHAKGSHRRPKRR